MTCWQCKGETAAGAATCAACGAVQPAGQASPFQRLGLEERFDLDDKDIERAWLQRSRAVHPDRFARKSDVERRYAAEQTAALNDAYRAIKDPFDRASVLVGARAVDGAKLDQALLVELMEARERAEESQQERAAVVDESVARYRALAAGLAADFGAGPAGLERAARALAEMKTLARLVDDLGGPKLIGTLDRR